MFFRNLVRSFSRQRVLICNRMLRADISTLIGGGITIGDLFLQLLFDDYSYYLLLLLLYDEDKYGRTIWTSLWSFFRWVAFTRGTLFWFRGLLYGQRMVLYAVTILIVLVGIFTIC